MKVMHRVGWTVFLALAVFPAACLAQAETAVGLWNESRTGMEETTVATFDLSAGTVSAGLPVTGFWAEGMADAGSDGLFMHDQHKVGRFDPATTEVTVIPYDTALPEISWLGGITWDSARNRLLVASSWHTNKRLYAYTPATQQWSVVTNLPIQYLRGWTYLPQEDRLAVLAPRRDMPGSSLRTLLKLDADGVVVKRIKLSRRIKIGLLGPMNTQGVVTSSGNIFVTIHDYTNRGDTFRFVVVDPNTGVVRVRRFLPAYKAIDASA